MQTHPMQAIRTITSGIVTLAMLALTPAVPAVADETTPDLLAQAQEAANQGKHDVSVSLLDRLIERNPTAADAFYVRGREQFRRAKFQESLADFDKFVELRPKLASRQWERGITCYYAGEFKRGADQFALYQTYHDNDVENSVWRYLCMARTDGVEKARAAILPIKNDPRVPMMAVYDLYRGRLRPEDVLAAAQTGAAEGDQLSSQLFYARLYVGLYFEAAGEKDSARKYLVLAADEHGDTQGVNRYMWDVARVHADRLRKKPDQ